MYYVVFVVILKFYASLWVQNWDIIQILELSTLNCHIEGIKNVAIYALSSSKFLEVRKYACVKDLTNNMSVSSSPMRRLFCKRWCKIISTWVKFHI